MCNFHISFLYVEKEMKIRNYIVQLLYTSPAQFIVIIIFTSS